MIKYGCKVCNRWFDQADKTDEWLWTDHIRLEDCTLSDKELGYITDKKTGISRRAKVPKTEDKFKDKDYNIQINFKNSDGTTTKQAMESF